MTTLPRLVVMTPERVVLSVDGVVRARLRLADEAWLSIYPHHAPLVAETYGGPVQYDTGDASGEADVAAGILYVSSTEILVLTSGLRSRETQASTSDEPGQAKFDRLAAQLMVTLNARSTTGDDETGAREG